MTAFFCVYSFSIFGKNQRYTLKKHSTILLFLVLVLLSCTSKSRKDENVKSLIDSIPVYLSLASDINLPFKYKQKYNQKASDIILSQKNDSLNRVNLFKVANRYFNMNDSKSYQKISMLVLERSINSKDSTSIAKAYTYLGDYYRSQMVSDSAFLNYFKAEKIYLRIKDEFNLAKIFLNKADLQFAEADFFESEIAVFKALKILSKQKNVNNQLYDCYNLLGILYNEREEYDKALEFHNKALLTLQDKSIPLELQLKAASLNNIGFVYSRLNNYPKAQIYFQKGLDEKDLFLDDAALYAMLLDNLAYSKFKSKKGSGLPREFYNALKIRDSLQLTSGIILSKMHLSDYYLAHKDSLRAFQFSKQALNLSRTSNKLRNRIDVLKQIANVDPVNAPKYSKEYIEINEKLVKSERNMGEKFSRIEYETSEIKDQNSSLQEKNKTLIYVFSICTLIGLFFYVYKIQQEIGRAHV